ncbi:MAG: hypothetical protein ACOYB0_09740 [Polynucleobacter sp.]
MGGISSKMLQTPTGDVLVFHDNASEASWVDAIGRDVRKWEMRYGTDFTTACEYTVTAIGADTIVQGIVAGRRALITTAAAANSGVNLQTVGTPFQLASGKKLYFGAKLTFNTADGNDFFVGLASTDTAIIAAHAIDIGASAAGWYALSSTALVAYNEIHANSKTTTATPVLDTNPHIYEFLYDGTNLNFYLDHALVAQHTTYVPTVVMAPSIVLQSSAVGAAETCAINWMRCIQLP